MQSNLCKCVIISSLIILISSCDPTTYISKNHYFNDDYRLTTVNAPKYPFDNTLKQNTIRISFPKQNEFVLKLSNNSCSGEYEANTDGSISFTRTSCSEKCCDTDWDYYIITLIKKATKFEGGNDKPLFLFIDNTNYLILEISDNSSISVQND